MFAKDLSNKIFPVYPGWDNDSPDENHSCGNKAGHGSKRSGGLIQFNP
jgi:hypothetical protein